MTELNEYLPVDSQLSPWVRYPPQLLELIHDGKFDFTPWHLLKFERALDFSSTICKAFRRELFAFAYRQDTDDFACFENGYCDNVKMIDLGASKGFESGEEFSFGKWLDVVKVDSDEW